MDIKRKAVAGTLESSDVFVEVLPHDSILLEIDSVVYEQFGEELEKLAREVLAENNVSCARISLKDRGALECTLRARLETALRRAESEVEYA